MNSDLKQTYSVGERHKSNAINIIENEKVNPKTQKIVKLRKRKCNFCGRFKSQTFNK